MSRAARYGSVLAACALSACELVWGIGETVPDDQPLSGGSTGAAAEGGRAAGGNAQGGTRAGTSGSGAPSAGEAGQTPGGGGVRPDSGGGATGIAGEPAYGGSTPEYGGTGGQVGRAGAGDGGSDTGGSDTGGSNTGGSDTVVNGSGGGQPGLSPHPEMALRPFLVQHPWSQNFPGVCYTIEDKGVLDNDALAARQALVTHARQLVDENWIRNIGRIHTVIDWAECVSAENRIQLVIGSAASSSDLGYGGFYVPRTVRLNAAASDAEILHFFGRVLGFENEYGFEVAPGPCVECQSSDDCQSLEGYTCLGDGYCGLAADHESIMAAPGCSGIEPSRRLTPWDILAAQRAYGSKSPGAVVNRSGGCLNIPWASTDPQTLIQYPCAGVGNDSWRFSFGSEPSDADLLVARPQGQERCLRSNGAGYAMSALCERSSPSQDAGLVGVRWRGFGGICITADSADPGVNLRATECGTTPALDRWTIRAGRFQLTDTEYCATVQDVQDWKSPIVIEPCDTDRSDQNFVLENGLIGSPNGCMNVFGGAPITGSLITNWNGCRPDLENEVFYATGALRAGGDCLGIEDSLWVTASNCDLRASQEWDYHW